MNIHLFWFNKLFWAFKSIKWLVNLALSICVSLQRGKRVKSVWHILSLERHIRSISFSRLFGELFLFSWCLMASSSSIPSAWSAQGVAYSLIFFTPAHENSNHILTRCRDQCGSSLIFKGIKSFYTTIALSVID